MNPVNSKAIASTFQRWVPRASFVLFIAALVGICILSIGPTYTPTFAQSQAASAAPQYPELPAGPGRDTLIRTCSKCHSPLNVVANGQSRQGWEDTISKMVGYGADGTDDDYTAILEYLTKNFPAPNVSKINVNTATAQELSTALSLSQQDAEAIVHYRDQNGAFKSIEDLKKVPTIDPKKIDALSARLTF